MRPISAPASSSSFTTDILLRVFCTRGNSGAGFYKLASFASKSTSLNIAIARCRTFSNSNALITSRSELCHPGLVGGFADLVIQIQS